MAAVLLIFIGLKSMAQTSSFPSTRLGAYQIFYSGEKKESFSESESGQGFELTTQKNGSWISPYAKVRLTVVNGDQDFDDGTTEFDSSFTYYQGSLEIGSYFYPIERKRTGFNLFLGVGGILSYNYINLSEDDSLTVISAKEQSFSFGYAASLGGEWILSSRDRNKWAVIGEIVSRNENSKFLKKSNFSFNGFIVGLSLGF
ncbi:MAG: hypothetical protein ACK5V3_16035 [Bdellovibrionales bacterium]